MGWGEGEGNRGTHLMRLQLEVKTIINETRKRTDSHASFRYWANITDKKQQEEKDKREGRERPCFTFAVCTLEGTNIPPSLFKSENHSQKNQTLCLILCCSFVCFFFLGFFVFFLFSFLLLLWERALETFDSLAYSHPLKFHFLCIFEGMSFQITWQRVWAWGTQE